MKTKLFFGMLIAFLFSAGFTACSDDEKEETELQPLTFEKDSYELPKGRFIDVPIRSGNGDYSLKVENPDVLDAQLQNSEEKGITLSLGGREKGESSLYVTDKVSGETAKLAVKVTKGYLAFAIRESTHPALKKHVWIYLMDTKERECYFLKEDEKGREPSSDVLSQGVYSVSTDQGKNYLTLIYASDKEEAFTDAEIAPTIHKFDLTDSDSYTFSLMRKFLHISWDATDRSGRFTPPKEYHLLMRETGTAYEVDATVKLTFLPEGLLK